MNELQAGVYKHYKGGLYLVLGVAQHTETGEKLVTYIPLSVQPGPRIAVRPYDMFFEEVTAGGRQVPRFMFIGQEAEPAIAHWYDPLSGYRGADRVND